MRNTPIQGSRAIKAMEKVKERETVSAVAAGAVMVMESFHARRPRVT